MAVLLKTSALMLLLTSCGVMQKAQDARIAKGPYEAAAERLPKFYDHGFVVTRANGGTPLAQGDSLIFSGLALYALDCARGWDLSTALEAMVLTTGGALFRHPTLPNTISMDGALGFYRGVAKRISACSEAKRWQPVLVSHKKYMDAHDGRINGGDSATLPAGFDYVRDKLLAAVGAGDEPSNARLVEMEAATLAWTLATVKTKAACFRINLGLMSFQTVEMLGGKINFLAKNAFCAETKDIGLPHVDHWCGRTGLTTFLTTFQFNIWQYRLQRCKWEEADGANGEQPAVDYLVGWADSLL